MIARTNRRWIITLTIAAAVAFLLGFATAPTGARPEMFVPTVQDAYPETEGRAGDILGYGYAVCAGLDDGRTEADMARWLSGTPHEYLGIVADAAEFGEFVVGAAAETLCLESGVS